MVCRQQQMGEKSTLTYLRYGGERRLKIKQKLY